MKTKLLLLVVLFCLATSVNAQTKKTDEKPFTIGVGVMGGLPISDSDFRNDASFGYGVDLMGEYRVVPSAVLTLSAGYFDFAEKTEAKIEAAAIPLLAGVKFYFTNMLYCSAQVGFSFYTANEAPTVFTFAPGIGCKISERFDLLLKYQSGSKDGGTLSFLGLRAGLTF